jgi:hypothetical protein
MCSFLSEPGKTNVIDIEHTIYKAKLLLCDITYINCDNTFMKRLWYYNIPYSIRNDLGKLKFIIN